MFKKIAVITGLLFTLIPITNAFAYEGGLMNGKPVNIGNVLGQTKGILTTTTDNSFNESDTPGMEGETNDTVWYHFSEPVTIGSYLLKTAQDAKVSMYFYDNNQNLISSVPLTVWNGTTTKIATVSKISYVSLGGANQTYNLQEWDVFDDTPIPVNHQELSSLTISAEGNKTKLKWETPAYNPNFVGTKIYRDGKYLTTVSKGTTSYEDTGTELKFNTSYTYKIAAIYDDDIETEGITKTIKTEESLELKNVSVKADYNKVDLSWRLPVNESLKHVNIYRDKVEQQTALSTILLGEKVSAAAQTKIFETNGTYFNDLTVEPNTTYDYTLSITDTNGAETAYNDLQVKTPKEPTPVIVGGNLSKDENGDYTYTWEEPTKGQVKVLVGGKEYKTVNGSDKKIIIPAADMKYTVLKDPDIKLIPISEYGTVGETTKPPTQLEKTELPFSVGEFIKTGSGLLWWVAPFVLLGLAFFLVPKLRNLITRPFKKGGDGEKDATAASEGNERTARTTGVRERQLRTPTIRRERAAREQRVSRISIKEPRPEREGTKQGRLPREIRKGR